MKQQPWHDMYDEGVPTGIKIPETATLDDFIRSACLKYSDRSAFSNFDSTITYRELDRQIESLASYFQHIGLKKGDRIAVQLPNLLQTPVAIFAALRAGCIVVNTNPLYTSHEMLVQFADSGAKAVVILENFADKLEAIIPQTQIEHVVIASIGDLLGSLKGRAVNFVLRNIRKEVPAYSLSYVRYTRAVEIGSKRKLEPVDLGHEETAFLQYTGGTTGTPKGAMLSHRNVIANILQIRAWFGTIELREGDVFLVPLPMYHIFSLTCNFVTTCNFGLTNVLITDPRDIGSLLKQVAKHRVKMMIGVSTLFRGMLSHPHFSRVEWEKIDVIVSGGSSLDEPIARRFTEHSGNVIIEGYGLSEASPIVACGPFNNRKNVVTGTVGMPVPDTMVRIIDENGAELPQGESGEIAVRGPQVMQGYWRKDEDTRAVLRNGWLLTGDIGFIDEKGYVTIVGRKKDIIYVSGFNVYPSEIEEVISKHPAVQECVVIGVKDEKSGERPFAFAVLKPESDVTPEQMKKYCAEFLTRYKIPKQVLFVSALPKNMLGKVIRNEVHSLLK